MIKRYEAAPRVTVVAGELRQVISNLLSNGLDVMSVGGRLGIAVRPSFDWRNPQRRGVRISITDTGPGIPREFRHRLFEAFFSTKADFGTGLGLWVSKAIIEKHGGSIRFHSWENGSTGTCFSIFLPADSAEEEASRVA